MATTSERAPSIGAKTARRLGTVGVTTVADFLEEDADQLATMLGQRSITGRQLKDWQDQARLVMDVPGLRGTHAQLLVGAGYRNAEAIADADADALVRGDHQVRDDAGRPEHSARWRHAGYQQDQRLDRLCRAGNCSLVLTLK